MRNKTLTKTHAQNTPILQQTSDTGYSSNGLFFDQVEFDSAKPWINEWNENRLPQHLSRPEQPKTTHSTNVFVSTVVQKPVWTINLFRSIFDFYGPDRYLIEAFVARDMVWDVTTVLRLLTLMVHDPEFDPLMLSTDNRSSWFPVFTVNPTSVVWHDEQSVRGAIRWMSVHLGSEKHLGKRVWQFRTLYTLDDFFNLQIGKGDVIYDKGSRFFFRNNPLPRERPEHYTSYNPARYGE